MKELYVSPEVELLRFRAAEELAEDGLMPLNQPSGDVDFGTDIENGADGNPWD